MSESKKGILKRKGDVTPCGSDSVPRNAKMARVEVKDKKDATASKDLKDKPELEAGECTWDLLGSGEDVGQVGKKEFSSDVLEGCRLSDSSELLLVFPEELWRLILKKVGHSSDLESLSNSSVYFYDLLHPLRVHFLFPKALENIAKNILVGKKSSDKNGVFRELQSLPGSCLSNREWNRLIINLRQVCQAWRLGVNSYFENHRDHKYMVHDETKDRFCDLLSFLTKKYQISVNTSLFRRTPTSFVNHFGQSPEDFPVRNPFIGRKIIVSDEISRLGNQDDHQRQLQQFWNQIETVLSTYGNHLWHCVIVINSLYVSNYQYIGHIKECLTLQPNLRTLQIEINNGNIPEVTKSQQMDMELKMNPFPFPKMQHLEYLKLKQLPTVFFNHLIEVYGNINFLQVERKESNTGYLLYLSPLPNLEKLAFVLYSRQELLDLEQARPSWPLIQYFCLSLSTPSEDNISTVEKLFAVIDQIWGSSTALTGITISLPILEKFQSRILSLNLQNVKRLKVILCSPINFDFMLPMKTSLEVLEVQQSYASRLMTGTELADQDFGQVQFYGFQKNLYKSNLSNLFPKLVTIRMISSNWYNTFPEEVVTYTRQGWFDIANFI